MLSRLDFGERIALMKADAIPCLCTAAYCNHENVACGKPVTMTFPIRQITGRPGEFGPEIRIGICEDCWSNIEKYGSV